MHPAKPRVLAASRPVKPIIIAAADMIVAALAPVAALAARRGHFDDLDTYLTYWLRVRYLFRCVLLCLPDRTRDLALFLLARSIPLSSFGHDRRRLGLVCLFHNRPDGTCLAHRANPSCSDPLRRLSARADDRPTSRAFKESVTAILQARRDFNQANPRDRNEFPSLKFICD